MSLSITVEQDGNKRILRLDGRLDAQAVSSLEKEIGSLFVKQHRKIILDFAQIEDLSSDCLEMLFSETKKFKEGRGNLGLTNINDALMEKIKKAGFDRVLFIYRDEQIALKAMA
jgi:anti-anti-sigma factor